MSRFSHILVFGVSGLFAGAVLDAKPAYAQSCVGNTITPIVETQPDRFGAFSDGLLFDGDLVNRGEGSLRLREPPFVGENALVVDLGQLMLAGSSVTVYFDVADGDGGAHFTTVSRLQSAGLGADFFDRNGNGQLDASDFDANGDFRMSLDSGDFAPIGFRLRLFDGNPGSPAGSSGVLVLEDFTPVQLLTEDIYSFTISSTTPFDHIVVESLPDLDGGDPRLTEIQLNGIANRSFEQGDCDAPVEESL